MPRLVRRKPIKLRRTIRLRISPNRRNRYIGCVKQLRKTPRIR